MPEERLRDLGTHYATTPSAREMILLHVLAHTVAGLVVDAPIRNRVRTGGLDTWPRAGLALLGAGFALRLVLDAAELTAVGARPAGTWTGSAPPRHRPWPACPPSSWRPASSRRTPDSTCATAAAPGSPTARCARCSG